MVTIRPKSGSTAAFEAGYKQHLEWHRAKNDTWQWHGWNVITGKRLGMFVDGTFNRRWEDFDKAVDPPGDAADNAANVSPHAEFLDNTYLEAIPAASNGDVTVAPTRLLESFRIQVRPSALAAFEPAAVKAFKSIQLHQNGTFTLYRVVNGGSVPAYVLMISRASVSELQTSRKVGAAIAALPGVESVENELLRYRSDMSYIPQKP